MKSIYGGKVSFGGTNTSGNISVINKSIVALILPAGFLGTAITYEASKDGVVFYPVHDELGVIISTTVAASRVVALDPRVTFTFGNYIRLVSNATETVEIDVILDIV